ncbi:protein Obscurin-like [Saccoglossus kowalevskii]
MQGQTVVLEVEYDGSPEFEIDWFWNGDSRYFNDLIRRIVLESPLRKARLTINNYQPTDNGIFWVLIKNPHGSDYSECHIPLRSS